MQNIDPLIRTKLRLPFIRPSLVPRPRLQTRIAAGLQGALTLVIAPAGFGKTTLVAASLADCKMPVAWLSLDRGDNQTGRFLNYLIAALRGVDPQIGSEAAQLSVGMQQPPAEAMLTSLVNDLDLADREIVLVLDDYQFIHSQVVHEQTAFLLEHCPNTFHMLIVSRSDPLLPLARWRVRGQAVELRAADLRFTGPEAAQFLNDVMGLHLDAESVAVLEERTEGWIAGLQMAALSMRDREDVAAFIEGFSGTNRYILDYLLEEVLAREPEEVQSFLLQTALLTRLSGSLCDAVIGNHPEGAGVSGSQEMLQRLERRNLFVVALDDNCCWYRYHHLFAELLQSRLYQSRPELIAQLLLRAAEWCEREGQAAEAVGYALAARDYEKAAELIERYGPARLAESDPSVFEMSEGLPPEMLLARPKIGLYQAWLLIIEGRIGKALPLLNDLARYLAGAAQNSGQSWMRTIVASALAFLTPARSIAEFDPLPDYQVLDEIPAEELLLRNAADFLYGMALARRGEFDRAADVAVKCIEREKSSHGTSVIPTLAPFLTRIYLMQGHLHATASLCREFLDPISGRDIRFVYTAGSMKIDLGEVLYERNCLEEAEQHIREGLQANEHWKNIMTDGFGLVALTRVLQAKGDHTGAMQIVEKFETRLLEHSRPPREFDEDLRTLRIRLQLASGDLQITSHWADQIQRSEDFDLRPELYRLTLARIRLAQGAYAEVENLLAGMTPLMTARSVTARQLESNLLLAAALARQQRLSEAFGMIESLLAVAEPEEYIRIFLDVGDSARELLAAYLRSDAPGYTGYAQKVLDAFSQTSQVHSPSPQQAGLIEPLSKRELEVLQLMALGKTNQEIAQQLIVAPGTVKAHTASIYRKLDAANRTEAVAHARQLGLLH